MVVACLKIFYQHLPEGCKEKGEKLWRRECASRLSFIGRFMTRCGSDIY
jgi:hypothetical protein